MTSFECIPELLVLATIQKTKPVAFTRLLRSCRYVNSLIENNKKNIKVLLNLDENVTTRLHINITSYPKESRKYRVVLEKKDGESLQPIYTKDCVPETLEAVVTDFGFFLLEYLRLWCCDVHGCEQLANFPPIIDVLERNHFKTVTLCYPACDTTARTFSIFKPKKWEIHAIENLSSFLSLNTEKMELSFEVKGRIFSLSSKVLLSAKNLHVYIPQGYVKNNSFSTALRNFLANVALENRIIPEATISFVEVVGHQSLSERLFDGLRSNTFTGFTFAYPKDQDKRSSSLKDLELFEISMSDSRLHFVFMIHTEEKVKECIKHINYKIVESWKELVEFIGKIVHTNEELMMKDVKFNEFKEALFPSEETSTST